MKKEYDLKKLKKRPGKVRVDPSAAIVTVRDIVKGYDARIVFSDKDKAYIVTVPQLKGCVTHGSSYPKAKKMAKQAIKLYLESQIDEKTRKKKVRAAFDEVHKKFPKTLKNLAK